MSNEEKPRIWNPFAPALKITEAEQRLKRIEELRRDLFTEKAPGIDKPVQKTFIPAKYHYKEKNAENNHPTEYALNTLLAMLWVETETGRLAVACALSDSAPQLGKSEAPVFAARLCAHLDVLPTDPLAIPSLSLAATSQSASRRDWAIQAVIAILSDTLTTIKHLLQQRNMQENEILYRETDACRDALRLGMRLHSPALVDTTLRLLRLFTPDFVRETGPIGHQTPVLRTIASQLLADLSPDDLFPFWITLSGPDSAARRDLLSVLDYFHDPRAVPYLVKLLEQRTRWSGDEMIGWASVRALQRFGDRRALPVLRQIADMEASAYAKASVSPELARAARNVIEAIEHGRVSPERSFLLRSSQAGARDLLLPTSDVPEPNSDASELLRTDIPKPE